MKTIKKIILILALIVFAFIVLAEFIYKSPICQSDTVSDSKKQELLVKEYIIVDSIKTLSDYIKIDEIFLEHGCMYLGLLGRQKLDSSYLRLSITFDYIKENYLHDWIVYINGESLGYQSGTIHKLFTAYDSSFDKDTLLFSIIDKKGKTDTTVFQSSIIKK